MTQPTISFIVGPTAVGKTEVAFLLAKRLSAEIISCDAMQVYKEINIASAKPSDAQLKEIKHHCLNIASVTEDFNVGRFREAAIADLHDIQLRGKNVIFCGGSPMYMAILLDGIFEQASRDPLLREKLQKQAIVDGIGVLHRKLTELDSVAAGKIHRNDAKRIVRALEVCMSIGIPFSTFRKNKIKKRGFTSIKIGLMLEKEMLHNRINKRVDDMMQKGLLNEVKKLYLYKNSNSLQTVGYKELFEYIDKKIDLETATELIKRNTRQYAKRQMTWFKKDENITWFAPNEEGKIITFLNEKIK